MWDAIRDLCLVQSKAKQNPEPERLLAGSGALHQAHAWASWLWGPWRTRRDKRRGLRDFPVLHLEGWEEGHSGVGEGGSPTLEEWKQIWEALSSKVEHEFIIFLIPKGTRLLPGM